MALRYLALMLKLTLGSSVGASIAKAETPEPGTVAASLLGAFGDCSLDTFGASLAEDASRIDYAIDRFVADFMPAGPMGADVSGSCYAAIALRPPVGWQVAIDRLTVAGYAFLDEGATAGGSVEILSGTMMPLPHLQYGRRVEGPFRTGRFQGERRFRSFELNYSACDGSVVSFTLLKRARIVVPAMRRGYLDLGSPEFGDSRQSIGLAWRSCR